ncbi:MAG: xanthine dehydrogenase [Nevskia sp.]|nr:xanthine dehydrogenase [Nevskia sp.]
MTPAMLDTLLAAGHAGKPIALLTQLDSGAQCWVDAAAVDGDFVPAPALAEQARALLNAERSECVGAGTDRVFVQALVPPPKLLLIGAVHIAQPLAQMATLAGYAVTLIDPRTAFAESQRFDSFQVLTQWPDAALATLRGDARTALVTLTHDPKLDDPALDWALRSDSFYIGALGSRKTHATRRQRLAARGFTPEQLARIQGPVGLSIGALTPAEIAVSILAQLIQRRRSGAV